MKKFLFGLSILALTSCSRYADGTSVWGGGSFLLFWLPIIGAVLFAIAGYNSWKSGTITGGSASTPQTHYSDKRLPVWKVWQWVFAAALVVFAIVVVIVQNANK